MATPLESLYRRNASHHPQWKDTMRRHQSDTEAWERIDTEFPPLVDALYRGSLDASVLTNALAVNPHIGVLMRKCRGNLYKAVGTAARILGRVGDLNSKASGEGKEAEDAQQLLESLFGNGEPPAGDELEQFAQHSSGDDAFQRARFAMDAPFQESLEQGDEKDDAVSASLDAIGGSPFDLSDGIIESLGNKLTLDLIDEFGRFMQMFESSDKVKVENEVDIKDVVQGDNLEMILDDQWLEYIHRSSRLNFLRQYAEAELLQYELDDEEPQDSGPIVVFLDDSGSTTDNGSRVRAILGGLAMAVARRCHDQSRECHVYSYGSSLRELFYTSGAHNLSRALSVCTSHSGGGTDLRQALTSVSVVYPFGAEVLVLTDGDDAGNIADLVSEFDGIKKAEELEVALLLVSNSAGYYAQNAILDRWTDFYDRYITVTPDAIRDGAWKLVSNL